MERKVTLVCNTLVLSGRYKRLGLESAVRTGGFETGTNEPIRISFPFDQPQALDSIDIA
jgi:hypothetical protein